MPQAGSETTGRTSATGPETISDLSSLLDALDQVRCGAEEGEAGEENAAKVPVGRLLEQVGGRSFGVLLLLPGLLMVSPLSGIPGLPSAVAVAVVLIAGQMVLGKDHFTLPQWVRRRGIPCDRLDKALRFLRPGARFVDRLLKPRLCFLTAGIAGRLIALLAIVIAASMIPMDLVPFANTTAGLALTTLGLALVARDGVMLLLGLAFCAGIGTVLMLIIR